jgi:hypothetical protein
MCMRNIRYLFLTTIFLLVLTSSMFSHSVYSIPGTNCGTVMNSCNQGKNKCGLQGGCSFGEKCTPIGTAPSSSCICVTDTSCPAMCTPTCTTCGCGLCGPTEMCQVVAIGYNDCVSCNSPPDTYKRCNAIAMTCGGDGCDPCQKCKKWGSSTNFGCQDDPSCPVCPEQPEAGFTDPFYNGPIITRLESILVPLGRILYYGGLFIGMCFIVLAGYTLMTSEGNPQKTQEGQEQLTAAILGIAFILLSSAILRVIISLV